MSRSTLLPQSFWFRLALPCNRLDALPRAKGRLLDLPDSCRLPDLSALEGHTSAAEVRAAWNPRGLAVAFEMTGKVGSVRSESLGGVLGDSVQLWIDTRDTRTIHRASRFCQRFVFAARPSGKSFSVEIAQRPIARAQADAPLADLDSIATRAELIRGGWRLEVWFPEATLAGFDPDTNRRLGFTYQVSDPERGDTFLTVGRDFPIGEDPSLWSTLELVDP